MKKYYNLILLALTSSSFSTFATDSTRAGNSNQSPIKIKLENYKDKDTSLFTEFSMIDVIPMPIISITHSQRINQGAGQKRSSPDAFEENDKPIKKEEKNKGPYPLKRIKIENAENEDIEIFHQIIKSSKDQDERNRQNLAITPLYQLILNPRTQQEAENQLIVLAQSDVYEQRATARDVIIKLLDQEETNFQSIGKRLLKRFCASQNRNERNTASGVFIEQNWERTPLSREVFQDLVKSDNGYKTLTAVQTLTYAVQAQKTWAKSEFQRLAASENLNERTKAIITLEKSYNYDNDWAKSEFLRLSKSNNFSECDTASCVLDLGYYHDATWAKSEFQRLTVSDDEHERKIAYCAMQKASKKKRAWIKLEFTRMAKSKNFHENIIATNFLQNAINNNLTWAEPEFRRFAASNNISEYKIAFKALANASIMNHPWADQELRRLARSNNNLERDIAAAAAIMIILAKKPKGKEILTNEFIQSLNDSSFLKIGESIFTKNIENTYTEETREKKILRYVSCRVASVKAYLSLMKS